MNKTVRAALNIFGLSKLPKTQDELKAVYRRHVKMTHPDKHGGEADAKPFHRVKRAREVLSEAIDIADIPCVWVKFGEGEPQQAKVVKKSQIVGDFQSSCKFVVALHWFSGMYIQVEDGEWLEVTEPKDFSLGDILVCFV